MIRRPLWNCENTIWADFPILLAGHVHTNSRMAGSKMNICILPILVLTLLATSACSTLVTALLKGTATIPCNAPQSVTAKGPLEIYWQKKSFQNTEVVLVTLNGQEVPDHQTKKYVNRATQDPNDLVLYLDQVTVTDEGTYECIVNHKPGEWRIQIHKADVQLKVVANFSGPELTQEPEGKVKIGTRVKLTCFSNEGYPAPEDVTWIVSSRNGSTKFKGEVHKTQDNSTKLYNLVSIFILNFTRNVNVSCMIHQTEPLGSVASRTVSLEEELMENHNRCVGIIAGVVTTLVALGVGVGAVV